MNYLGQIIKTERHAPPQYLLNLSAFSSGIYFLELTKMTGERRILKVFKEWELSNWHKNTEGVIF